MIRPDMFNNSFPESHFISSDVMVESEAEVRDLHVLIFAAQSV